MIKLNKNKTKAKGGKQTIVFFTIFQYKITSI